ncbi:MAG: DUF4810 domain-containing protein [Desulfovibrio sp.]
MKISNILFAVCLCVLLTGCSGKKPMYYWGDYSNSYYDHVLNQSDDSLTAHVTCLEEIIEKSEQKGLNVPPGVYAEYGFYMLKTGQYTKAQTAFMQEKVLYPESTVLMDRMLVNGKDYAEEDNSTVGTPVAELKTQGIDVEKEQTSVQ